MKISVLALTAFFFLGCSSIKTIGKGKKYEVDCHSVIASDDSCAAKVADNCPNGHTIEKSVSKYKLLQGPYRSVTVACK
jgi:hypothetical protein